MTPIKLFYWPLGYYSAFGIGPNDRCQWPTSIAEPSEGHFHPEASDTFRQSLKRDARQWKIQGQLMAYLLMR